MKVLHFGAGNIGRGFIGKLLSESGFEVIFVDVNQPVIDLINNNKEYIVNVVGDETYQDKVTNISALNSNSDNVIKLFNEVNLITTAVGPNVLKFIAPVISKGIEYRNKYKNEKSLNIIACENMLKASSHLKSLVIQNLSNKQLVKNIGFVDSAVDRIVPPAIESDKHTLDVTVESFYEWIVDENQFYGDIPKIHGIKCVDNLLSYVERKLFTLNTGHAITAYLGNLKNFSTIDKAIQNSEIQTIVTNAMKESGEVLIKRYGFDRTKHINYIHKILERFHNPYLNDDVKRVGREPLRKLSPNERLIKPLSGTIEFALPNNALLHGIAAAFHYDNPNDNESIKLQEAIDGHGFLETLSQFTGLEKDSLISKEIYKIYKKLK
ncbi:mannitol-1-phosphate 5-dehydrogenase [Paraphotobacterium marinum]|uniref:Mannitol-1-phosphate 5-dehydrogenase n=1 Tax=Paraphotobacterium marinum TaxID=1755811 RepID=A0A220VGV0_9GAMM|nr:mannitol-1-phosphate 5-dehydrogenase [Paraphotobacterium marinum]ASK79614.1 mannitol-1-phosphate 5-dehydrogenase [Paraphotobacterium marinum]